MPLYIIRHLFFEDFDFQGHIFIVLCQFWEDFRVLHWAVLFYEDFINFLLSFEDFITSFWYIWGYREWGLLFSWFCIYVFLWLFLGFQDYEVLFWNQSPWKDIELHAALLGSLNTIIFNKHFLSKPDVQPIKWESESQTALIIEKNWKAV